jgi:hypothetical protein
MTSKKWDLGINGVDSAKYYPEKITVNRDIAKGMAMLQCITYINM